MGWTLEGMHWDRKITVSSSVGSTQNAVPAAPPQLNSPSEPRSFCLAASWTTAKPSPNPEPPW